MSTTGPDDGRSATAGSKIAELAHVLPKRMTTFVESCVETAVNHAVAAEKRSRRHPRARRLLRVLADKKNILVTTHQYPDPDALASSLALCKLLRVKLPEAKVSLSVKGLVRGGLNAAFAQQTELDATPWDESRLRAYDAIVLLDVQPNFRYNPLPADIVPTAVIDHHRTRGPKPTSAFCDIRTDVGASSSIIFSYYMELDEAIDPDLAATMLFAIETDLAGAAGQPGGLDNVAVSNLTLRADTRKLYKMRYVDLPQSYYYAYCDGLHHAVYYDDALISHLDTPVTPETPAVIADFLLRFDQVQWVLVTAVHNTTSMQLSLRSGTSQFSAADVMRRLLRKLGEGGGHRTKAGGIIPLETGSAAEIDRIRKTLRRRLLRSLKIKMSRGQRLVPRCEIP